MSDSVQESTGDLSVFGDLMFEKRTALAQPQRHRQETFLEEGSGNSGSAPALKKHVWHV